MNYIKSNQNPEIKNIVKLHESKNRKEQNKFIIEGQRAVETALANKLDLENIYITENNLSFTQKIISENKINIVSEAIMQKISAAATPSGILAIFKIPQKKITNLNPGLVLAQISDPGNMGTLIRTAAACDIKNVIIVEGVDPWSPKVVQSSAGTISQINIIILSWPELIKLKKDLKLYGLVVKGGKDPEAINSKEALIVVANEARGLPQDWQKDCDDVITLKMPGQTESLNAAIAGSIALYLTFVK